MDILAEIGCGIDVHQKTLVACLISGKAGRKVNREVQTFATTTSGVLALRDWLKSADCTHVAMESTGVYWRPVYALLEDDFSVVVGNAQRIKNVPGRKTDVKDSEWIAELLRHGLIPPSFVPERPQRALRDMVRFRRSLVEARTSLRNRILQVLEYGHIKLASVASDVFGVSGMDMLRAIVEGTRTPAEIANLARGKLRNKLSELELALTGSVTDDHRFMLNQLLRAMAEEDKRIDMIEKRIDAKLEPFRAEHDLLTTAPGVNWLAAAAMIGEHGVDMTVFGNPERFSAWSGTAPGNNESAGKHRRSGTRKGNRHLKAIMSTVATSAVRKNGTYLQDKHRRLCARIGRGRATGAIAHKLSIAVFHMLSTRKPYRELGAAYLDQRSNARTKNHLVRRLKSLGYDVALTKLPA